MPGLHPDPDSAGPGPRHEHRQKPEPEESTPGRERRPLSPLLGLIFFLPTSFQKRKPVREGLPQAFVHSPNKAQSPCLRSWWLLPGAPVGPTVPSHRSLQPSFSCPWLLALAAVASWSRDVLRSSSPHACKGLSPHQTSFPSHRAPSVLETPVFTRISPSLCAPEDSPVLG